MNLIPKLLAILFGTDQTGLREYLSLLLLACGAFAFTFAAYAFGIYPTGSGVILIHPYGALAGVIGALLIGYYRAGLVFGWLITHMSLLGYQADWAVFRDPDGSLLDAVACLFRLDMLTYIAVEAIVFAVPAFVLGYTLRWVITVGRTHWEIAE
ncbi:hypothetical protein HLRTI_003247 [Halorhabdus tiamatea SARL4B]|uniref:Uncharacterized protein n=2 Tax=Halorhabdus tiamatea SARL4B TaxID=1033806 RepID=U2F898_9EURY|nr:hypothetical protein [Halorhabdus tiamatea]ERJ04779.1 hypothetical protein HLRTI_003247 [Halorhabdus tiamatea SARL4B]